MIIANILCSPHLYRIIPTMKITIAIVEDDHNYNNALKKIIDYDDDLACVAQYFSGKSALEELLELRPDVVLMDIQLQDMLGTDLVLKLKKQIPNTHFLMCTSFEDDEKIFNSLKAGASGYLVKGESLEKILSSIKETVKGGSPMSFGVAKKVLNYFQNIQAEVNQLDELTRSEIEILDLLSKGLLYKEIADKKCISIDTVKKHVGNVYRKLHVNNKVEAINKLNQLNK